MRRRHLFTILAVGMVPLLRGNGQTIFTNTAPAPPAIASAHLSVNAAEIAKLAQSGLSDDVILAFIGQSHAFYNLSVADMVALKDSGVSSAAMSAMLNHD